MSEQQHLAEQAYEDDARRWLRVYPPRWRRAREDEVVGVLLDTRPAGATRLAAGVRWDLLRGSVGYRWRTHPPLVAWLMWRFGQARLPVRYAEWVRDDVAGRLFPLRLVWCGWFLLFVLVNLWLQWGGPAGALWLLGGFALAASVAAMVLVRDGVRRRTVDDAVGWQQRIEQVDRPGGPRWSGARRWAYGRWLVGPVVAGWGGLVAVGTVAVAALVAAPEAVVAAGTGPVSSDPSPVLPAWAAVWLAWSVAAVVLCGPRVRHRPAQPWRAEPRTPPAWVVATLTVVAALLPPAVAAPRLEAALAAVQAPSSLLLVVEPVVSALTPLWFAASFLGAPLLAAVVVAPLVHLRVRRDLAARPEPAPALLDVLGLHGGREVLTDPPTVPADPVPWA